MEIEDSILTIQLWRKKEATKIRAELKEIESQLKMGESEFEMHFPILSELDDNLYSMGVDEE